MAALRKFNIPPGDYLVPCGGTPDAMKSPDFIEKMNKGPMMMATVMPNGIPPMGPIFAMWFAYCAVISVFGGYVAGRALGPGAPYLDVFRFAGTVAFAGYGLALWQNSIWYRRSWATTMRSNIDGLVYGMLTGGTFGWLWPK